MTNNMPRFTIAPCDVVNISTEVVSNRDSSFPNKEISVVHFEFSTLKAAEFHEFTRQHLNQKVQILVGTNVVEEPRIMDEIPGPDMELTFSSPKDAHTVAISLSKK
jgi:preprotein translocase subunit SecD